MHPQRIEAIADSFPAHIVLHSYVNVGVTQPMYAEIIRIHGQLRRSFTGCAVLGEDYNAPIHHAHVSVRWEVLQDVIFHEGEEWARREDSIFCGEALARPGRQNVYISNPLSYYDETGQTMVDEYFKK